MKNKPKIYLSFLLSVLCGLGIFLNSFFRKTSEPIPKPESFALNSQFLISDSLSNTNLLSYYKVNKVNRIGNTITVNNVSLQFTIDSSNNALIIPNKIDEWNNYFMTWLGEANINDTNFRFNSTKGKMENIFRDEIIELNKTKNFIQKSKEIKLYSALIRSINGGNIIYFQGNSIFKNKSINQIENKNNHQLGLLLPIDTKQKSFPLINWVLLTGLILGSLFSIYFLNQLLENRSEIEPELEIESFETVNSNLIVSKPEIDKVHEEIPLQPKAENSDFSFTQAKNEKEDYLLKYAESFNSKFGDFFSDIQAIPVKPNVEEERILLQKLIEMGLIGHTLMRAIKMGNLDRPEKNPNLKLLLENFDKKHVNENTFREFVLDPEKIEKRYIILFNIFKKIGIERLDNAFINDIDL